MVHRDCYTPAPSGKAIFSVGKSCNTFVTIEEGSTGSSDSFERGVVGIFQQPFDDEELLNTVGQAAPRLGTPSEGADDLVSPWD
jgi:hypothetical protein